MFSGIVEALGKVTGTRKEKNNLHITLEAPFAKKLKVDQSVSHNGVCLTVVEAKKKNYTVTAVEETLRRSNLGSLKKGDKINLERCMKLGDRIDGHIVQGHVDCTAVCTSVKEQKGSWLFSFSCDKDFNDAKLLLVEKGSVCVNGVSLTLVKCNNANFSVAVIPYTFSHTNFNSIGKGSVVNIEFDIIGKYVVNTLR
ncbi:MAG TPA: riboflavin synthase [Bacteroidia bacterium]